jgi:hypothetical protein
LAEEATTRRRDDETANDRELVELTMQQMLTSDMTTVGEIRVESGY